MTTLIDINPSKKYYNDGNVFKNILDSNIPKLPIRPQYLWHGNYWDGPLNGTCLFRNRMHGFTCVDEVWFRDIDEEDEDDEEEIVPGRVFVVFKLTKRDIAHENYWHNLFRKHVGCHTDYHKTNRRTIGYKLKSRDKWKQYYDLAKSKKSVDYSTRPVVAWYGVGLLSLDKLVENEE